MSFTCMYLCGLRQGGSEVWQWSLGQSALVASSVLVPVYHVDDDVLHVECAHHIRSTMQTNTQCDIELL